MQVGDKVYWFDLNNIGGPPDELSVINISGRLSEIDKQNRHYATPDNLPDTFRRFVPLDLLKTSYDEARAAARKVLKARKERILKAYNAVLKNL